uniref:Transmembrane protein n=1 Tax=Romanomermis culicivorax TaxID=13658 RepID=A0A915JP41_ROMCU
MQFWGRTALRTIKGNFFNLIDSQMINNSSPKTVSSPGFFGRRFGTLLKTVCHCAAFTGVHFLVSLIFAIHVGKINASKSEMGKRNYLTFSELDFQEDWKYV